MSMRRWRPVAALTLAVVAMPFLAASAVAAQSRSSSPRAIEGAAAAVAERGGPGGVTIVWPARIASTPRRVLERLQQLAPPAPLAPAAPVKAAAPPPPPPVTDPTTWVWPADGPITSPFGPRWGRAHEGVDIDGAFGSAVIAPQAGTVTAAGWDDSGYGWVVEIDHGFGLTTRMAHLSSVGATVGQVVERGTYVGAVGKSGSVTAAHLHYEVRENGVARNPARWLVPGGASSVGHPG